MAEYVLRAEVTVVGGFGDGYPDPREFLADQLRLAFARRDLGVWPEAPRIRVAVVGTSGDVPFDDEDWLEVK